MYTDIRTLNIQWAAHSICAVAYSHTSVKPSSDTNKHVMGSDMKQEKETRKANEATGNPHCLRPKFTASSWRIQNLARHTGTASSDDSCLWRKVWGPLPASRSHLLRLPLCLSSFLEKKPSVPLLFHLPNLMQAPLLTRTQPRARSSRKCGSQASSPLKREQRKEWR